MTSPSKSNSTCAERQQSPSSPAFKSTLGPMDHALMTAATETKSNLSLVMDVTKKEEFITKVLVQRDRAGKLRYSINKESKCKMDGVVGASPSIYNRIREDSLAKDYIPEVGLSKRRRQKKRRSNRSRTQKNKPASKDSNATGKSSITSNVNQDDPAGPKNAKPNSDKARKSGQKPIQNKKQLEIHEQSQTRSNEVVFKDPDEMTREPVMGDVPASVENGVVTPVSTKANTTNSEPHQEALQEGGEQLMEQKHDQKQQSSAVSKYSPKNSSPQFMTAVEAKSPPASPTSKFFRLPPNPEAIKTPSPGKRAQSKVSPPASPVKQIPPTGKLPTSADGRPTLTKLSLDVEPNQDKQTLTSKDDKELKAQSVDSWKSIESKSSIPNPKTNETADKAKESETGSLSKQQPMGRSVKSLDDIQQSDKSKPEEKDAPTKTKLTTPKSVTPKESIVESHPQKVLSRKVSMSPIGKTGNLLSSQTQDSLLMFLTPVPGKSPAGSPTSKMFTIPPNADKIKTPSPPGKSQKETGTLLPLGIGQSGTPKTQQRKPKSSQSLKSLKSNPSIRIRKDDLKGPSLISVKEKLPTSKEMTPKDDSKKVQASEELTQDVAKAPEKTVISMQTPVKEQPPLTSPKQEVPETEPKQPSPIRDSNKVIETPKALPENAEVVAVGPPGKSSPKATPTKDPSEEEPKKVVPVDTSRAEEQKDTINVKEAEGKSKLESAQIPNQDKVIETPKSQPKKTVENEAVVSVCPLDKSTPTGKSSEEEPKKVALVVMEKEPRDINAKKHESEPKSEPKVILMTEEQMADLRKTPRSKSLEINTPDSAVYSIPTLTEELQNMIDIQEGSLEAKSPAKPVSLSTNGTSNKAIGTPSKVAQMVRALESVKLKSKQQPNDKQIGSEEAEKDHQPELKITSEKTPSKSIDETTNAPASVTAQPETPKEEIHSGSLKDKTSETEAPKEEFLVAKGGEKQQPKKSEGSPKANSEDSRKTPTPSTKPRSEEEASVVKLQSSMTAFNQKPETVGAPFENVQVQPSDEKVPHNASNMPLQKAIGTEQPEQPETMVTTTTVPFKLEPGLEALRLRDEPDKVNVVEPSMMKANDIQPETDQVEAIAKASSPQAAAAEPPNQLDPHLKFYYHQEANLRSMQTCYGNEISAGSSTVQQNEPIKSEGELISRQEMLMHKGDTFLEQMKEASSSKQAAAPATTAAALPSGPMAHGSQVQQSQGLSLKAKAVIAVATVAGFVIVAHMVNII